MDVLEIDRAMNFRKLEKGSLIRLVDNAQPVVFVEVIEEPGHQYDYAVLVCLDPIDDLHRQEYLLYENGELFQRGARVLLNPNSIEGRKYLEMITGEDS